MAVDISVLEGWLIKDKSKTPKYSFLGESNRRWFKVQLVRGLEGEELALCYFKDQRSDEPKGWVFARDVSEIKDEKSSFTLISPARTFRLRAQTRAEHKLWLTGIRAICPDASFEGEGAEMVTPRAEVKGTETRVSVTSPPPQEKNSALQRPKQPKTPQPPAEDKAAEQAEADRRRGSVRRQQEEERERERQRVDTPYDAHPPHPTNRTPRMQARAHGAEDMREVLSDRRRSQQQYRDEDEEYAYQQQRRRLHEDDYDRRADYRDRDRDRDRRRDDRDYDDDSQRQQRRPQRDRTQDEEEEYQRWKEERRAQPPPNGSTPSSARRGSNGQGNGQGNAPRPSPSDSTSATSRMHQHIRSGSGGSLDKDKDKDKAKERVEPPSSPLASEAIADSSPKPANARPPPKGAHHPPPREFLPRENPPDSDEESSEGEQQPPPGPCPSPDPPGGPKVKRTAADEFVDDKAQQDKPTQGEGGIDRLLQGAERPLDSDSDEEKVDFSAEKRKLRPSASPTPHSTPKTSLLEPTDSKDVPAPFDLPGEKPLPSSRALPTGQAPPRTKPPPPTSIPSSPGRAAMPKAARPKSLRAPSGPPPSDPSPSDPPSRPPISQVKADANFVEDDWDEDNGPKTPKAQSKGQGKGKTPERRGESKPLTQGGGAQEGAAEKPQPPSIGQGVKADENFADEDWD